MKDLVAIVTVRRLLLELGYALAPEDIHGRIGPLSLWISQPRPDLDGHSPMSALAQPGGEDSLRQCLARLVAGPVRQVFGGSRIPATPIRRGRRLGGERGVRDAQQASERCSRHAKRSVDTHVCHVLGAHARAPL